MVPLDPTLSHRTLAAQACAGAFAKLKEAEHRRHKVLHTDTMLTSASLCLEDAVNLFDLGLFRECKMRALDSLSYSIGVGGPYFKLFECAVEACAPIAGFGAEVPTLEQVRKLNDVISGRA